MLAGVGLFPLTVSVLLHNICAMGMAVAFFLLLLGSPVVLRGMSWSFFAVTGGFFLAMAGSVILFAVTGYFNLTFFELVVFMIIFGWIPPSSGSSARRWRPRNTRRSYRTNRISSPPAAKPVGCRAPSGTKPFFA